jgi:SAM-dependent methyltransferase
MKTAISKANPFGMDAKGYLWEYLSKHGKSWKHLDYGAHDAHMIVKFKNTGVIEQGVGIDLNSEAVARAQSALPEGVSLVAVKKNPRLPFENGCFDSTSIVGVLEHILDQDHILKELKRVTKVGGTIFVAVPGQHFFSFLDMGNWKFKFPRLHKLFYTLTHSEEDYVARYTANKDGLIGDIEAEKAWHQHFTKCELEAKLRANGLEIIETDGFGYFCRIFVNLGFFLPGRLKNLMNPLIKLDSRLFSSTEIWTMARVPHLH